MAVKQHISKTSKGIFPEITALMPFIQSHGGSLCVLPSRRGKIDYEARAGLLCWASVEYVIAALTGRRFVGDTRVEGRWMKAADILERSPVGCMSWSATVGYLLLLGGEQDCSYSREELKWPTLTTSADHMRSWEDERCRAPPVMHRLHRQDLTVARDIECHLHRDNKWELSVFTNQGAVCHSIHGCLRKVVWLHSVISSSAERQ